MAKVLNLLVSQQDSLICANVSEEGVVEKGTDAVFRHYVTIHSLPALCSIGLFTNLRIKYGKIGYCQSPTYVGVASYDIVYRKLLFQVMKSRW